MVLYPAGIPREKFFECHSIWVQDHYELTKYYTTLHTYICIVSVMIHDLI